MECVIFDIKRFALHDGPGIRTTIFLKGCPLQCAWCHNPEGRAFGVEMIEGRDGETSVGRTVSVNEVMNEIVRDTPFHDESGGGVTFSGGEPLAQHESLAILLDRCGELDIHRTVDTSGHAPCEVLLNVAKRTDLFLYDLKLADAAAHLQQTGVDSNLIRENLRRLCATGVAIEIRIPIVTGISATAPNLEMLGSFIQSLGRPLPLRLLPYHRTAMDKYPRFGLTPPLSDIAEPTGREMTRFRKIMTELGLEVRE